MKKLRVVEIDDVRFRKAIYSSVSRRDSSRRFEIHFSDILHSPIVSFYRKLFPTDFTEDDYVKLQTWMRGIGHEIGTLRMLKGSGAKSQKVTRLGKAVGSIDLILFGDIYELTTTLYLKQRKRRKMPFLGKAHQLIYYMASERKNVGKLKIFDLVIPQHTRTWKIILTDEDIEHYREIIRWKSNLFHQALMTGDWRILPRTTSRWSKRDERRILEFLTYRPRTVKRAHKRWLKERREWQISKI